MGGFRVSRPGEADLPSAEERERAALDVVDLEFDEPVARASQNWRAGADKDKDKERTAQLVNALDFVARDPANKPAISAWIPRPILD